MYSRSSEPVRFERDCAAVLVPQGEEVTLPAGPVGYITQALGGSYTIQLSKGTSSTYAPRVLTNGGSTLAYNLYTSNARNQVWGDGTGGSQTVTSNFIALLSLDQTTTVYGRIPAGQNVPPGSYSDTVLVTVIF